MNVLNAILNRRSVRNFSDKEIEKECIEKLIEAAQWAPSACNKQAWKFIAITDKRIKESLVKNAGSLKLVNTAPLTIAVIYHRRINEHHDANIQSASAAIQNMLLYAHSIGLGSLWVCSYGDEKKISAILKIHNDYRMIAFVCIGYPNVKRTITPKRKNIGNIVSYNQFDFEEVYPSSYNLNSWSFQQAVSYWSDAIYASSPTPDVYMEGIVGKEVLKQVATVLPKLSEHDKILEILPYAGSFGLNIVKRKKLDYSIVETDDKIFKFLDERKESFNITQNIEKILLTGDLKIPVEDSIYDKVLLFERLNFFPEHEKMISEIFRVLKTNGTFILTFKNKFSFTHISHLMSGKGELSPYELLSLGYMKRLLKKFEIVKTEGFSLTPITIAKKTFFKRLGRVVMIWCEKKLT